MFELLRGLDRNLDTPPPLPVRRISELLVEELPVIDLANPLALDLLQMERSDLTDGYDLSPETEICRSIASEVRRRRDVLGLLVPSAALPGADVLVIFPAGFRRVQIGAQQLVKLAILPAPEANQTPSDRED